MNASPIFPLYQADCSAIIPYTVMRSPLVEGEQGNRGDLVGFLFYHLIGQNQPYFAGPDADLMERRQILQPKVRASALLPIQAADFERAGLGHRQPGLQGRDPAPKAARQSFGLQAGKDPANGTLRFT